MAASEFDRRRLTLDCIFGVITQTEAAEQLGISVQRMSQLVAKMRQHAPTPQLISARVAQKDMDYRSWTRTQSYHLSWPGCSPEEFYYRELSEERNRWI